MTDWSISGGIPPKFWLGSSVLASGVEGIVYGLEWRNSKQFLFISTDWYYRVRWSTGHEQVLRESELEACS